jgi:hypothetical protein
MAKTGSDTSFQKASKDIKDYCGLEIGAKDIERVAEDIGVELEKSDIKKQNKLFSRKTIFEPTGKILKETTRMYIEYDGTGVLSTLKELKGRKGKQEDGTAKEVIIIGDGVIEAGCKNIIGKRLKQSGMRWSHKGANAIIALRCGLYSEKFDEFLEKQQAA